MGTHGAGRVGVIERGSNDCADGQVGIGARILTWASQLYCGLHGHNHMRQFAKRRMFLHCVSCGHESPGWTLPNSSPRLLVREDMRPNRIVGRSQLADTRRIA
jgi:hypothetical protein